jgi:hypothetical protein
VGYGLSLDMYHMKVSQKLYFGLRSPAKTQRDKKAAPSFNPPRLSTGSSTRNLKYVEELKREANKEKRDLSAFGGLGQKTFLRQLHVKRCPQHLFLQILATFLKKFDLLLVLSLVSLDVVRKQI